MARKLLEEKMKNVPVPEHFDGGIFSKQTGLDPLSGDYYIIGDRLYYPDKLGKVDLTDCVTDPEPAYSIERRVAYLNEGLCADELIQAMWEMVVENRPEKAQELQAKRAAIKERIPKE